MSYMESITAANDEAGERQATVVEALRCYARALRDGRPALPAMIALAEDSGLGAPAAVALASVFELTEGCLGRRLVPGGAAPARLSGDEDAVLRLLACDDAVGSHRGSAVVPHGLPGVLVWAIRSARRLWPAPRAAFRPADAASCPFGGRQAWFE